MKFALGFLVVAALVVFGAFFALNVHGIVPSPSDYAAATAMVMRAQAEATRSAIDTEATATVAAALVAARQTAVPNVVSAETDAVNRETQSRSWGTVGGIAVLLLIGLSIATFAQTRGRIIPRGKDGQLPGVRDGSAITDMQRAIGPTVIVRNPSIADYFRHIVHKDALPEPKIITANAGATADQLLIAAQSANMVTATAATFRPGLSDGGRARRVEFVQQAGRKDHWGDEVQAPRVRVMAEGDASDDLLRLMKDKFGDQVPALPTQTASDPT